MTTTTEETTTTQLIGVYANDASRNGYDWMACHKAGCKHVTRSKFPETLQWPDIFEAATLAEAAAYMASDFIAEGSMTVDEAIGYITFAPCVKLPRGEVA